MQKLSGQKCSCLVDWVEIVGAGGGGRGWKRWSVCKFSVVYKGKVTSWFDVKKNNSNYMMKWGRSLNVFQGNVGWSSMLRLEDFELGTYKKGKEFGS